MEYFRIISFDIEHNYTAKDGHYSKINRIRSKFMIMNVQVGDRITYILIIIFKFINSMKFKADKSENN